VGCHLLNRCEPTLCCCRRLPTSLASRMSWRTYWSMSSGTQTKASAQHSMTWAQSSTAVPVLHTWTVCCCRGCCLGAAVCFFIKHS
jgi:hypothetical protein